MAGSGLAWYGKAGQRAHFGVDRRVEARLGLDRRGLARRGRAGALTIRCGQTFRWVGQGKAGNGWVWLGWARQYVTRPGKAGIGGWLAAAGVRGPGTHARRGLAW